MTHVDKTKEGRARRRKRRKRKNQVRKSRLNTNRIDQDRLIEEEEKKHAHNHRSYYLIFISNTCVRISVSLGE